MKKMTGLLLAVLIMGVTVTKAQSSQQDLDDKYATELVKVGTVAPDFLMKTPDGKTIQLSKFAKGKTVVLDFWASWCPDCRKDAPEVVRLYEAYHPYGIEFIGISMDTDLEAWKKSIAQFGISYPQVSELKKFKETDIAKAYGVKWIPSIVVIGPDGQVKLSTVLTYKVDNYLKELTTGSNKVDQKPTTDLLGSWSGKLKVGTASITIVVHFEQADGYVAVSLDSPDQGAKGIPASIDYLKDDSVAVKVESLGAAYRARLKDGKLDGTFSQRGFSFPLVLTRGVPELNRPQTPKMPYPYDIEEVTFTNETDNATLAGTLTWPVGYDKQSKQKPLVVLFVSGSGQQNRDEELMGHKPFLVIADYLARQGIATLRYDDRATGKSVGGEVKNATTADFSRDALAGIEFLRKMKAFSKVGILGHSEGGSIAFMLGSKKKVDFIVSMAGPTVKGDTLLAAQSNRILSLSGQPATMTVEKYRQTVTSMDIPWINWFNDYDPSDDIRQIRCPVFALNGDHDTQVISSLCLPALKRLLPASKKHLVQEYPSLNHLFQHCTTGLPNEYSQIEETVSPEVLEDIVQWILSLK